jgi:tRNA_anti-like
MAIIPCRECAHQVSDQAASCPSCGAPSVPPIAVKTKPRSKHRLAGAAITLMALWTLGTLLWLIVPRSAADEWITAARLALQRFDRNIGQFPTADHSNATARSRVQANPATVNTPPVLPSRPVYRTTAEQLYQAYEANGVAFRTSIGGSLVRLTGNVTEIDQDATGQPVVKLWAGKDSTAAMTLDPGQRAAAAQLHKGQSVDIECDQVGRGGDDLQGSGCRLAFVDTRTRDVNLALFLANERGAARVYLVGPLSETVCRERSDKISSQVRGNQRGEHLVWRNCIDVGGESTPPEGCRLNSPALALPDVPTAHVWRYDCSPPNAARTNSHRSRPAAGTATASAATPSPAELATASPAPPVVEHATTNNLRLASSVAGTDIGAGPDDLTQIRAVDPRAANHIAAYCLKTTAPTNREALMACRRSETEAWTRLVLQNEFPKLDDATREKCSEPPFPDTYVAKENCARYELRAK